MEDLWITQLCESPDFCGIIQEDSSLKGGFMNWFIGAAGVIYILAAITYFIKGQFMLGVTFVFYAFSNFAIMVGTKE
jgi:hypothetical protein